MGMSMTIEKAALVAQHYADYLELKRFDLHFSQQEIIDALRRLAESINDTDDHK